MPLAVVAVLSGLLGAGTHKALTSTDESCGSSRETRLIARQNATIAALEAALTRPVERRLEKKPVEKQPVEKQPVGECERKFGEGLVESYRSSGRDWCGEGSSRVTCYKHTYEHNGKTGLFCEGFNVTLDPSKIKGSAFAMKKGPRSYLSFEMGATRADCRKTEHWSPQLFMPHMSPQLRGLERAASALFVEEKTTYLMARDEDCENMFHSTADHLNAFLVGRVLRLDWSRVKTMLWDRHPDGPFKQLIEKGFLASSAADASR